MPRPLEGRVALVTGAGRGIGRAIALGLAADGAIVAVNDCDADPAAAVVKEIEDAGGVGRAMAVSVVDFDRSRAMVDELVAEFGKVDILVSNAGIASSGKSLLRTPVDEYENLHRLNCTAALVLVQQVLPGMRAAGRGDVVMISSLSVEALPPRNGPYSMAKSALEALAFTLAKEEQRNGVRVNVVAPRMIDTRLSRGLIEKVAAAKGPADAPADLGITLADPVEVANVVRYFVAEPAGAVSGQKLTVGHDI